MTTPDPVRVRSERAVRCLGVIARVFVLALFAVPAALAQSGELDAPITYTARDSIRIQLAPRDTAATPDDRLTLFGDASATYEDATLRAAELEYRTGAGTLRARPAAGDTVGTPRFSRGDEAFSGRELTFNLDTGRGRIVGARTAIDDGYLIGGVIKQAAPDIVYAAEAGYTTCDLDHPHYALTAGRIKVAEGERVYTGPVRLRLLGLPTPLVLPFGYFPAAEGRRSGPLPFRPGNDNVYGVYLDNIGYYWAISDYLDAQVSGRLGSRGAFDARGNVRYAKRYNYRGDVRMSYGRIRRGESTDPDTRLTEPLSLGWSHNQTFPAGQTLTASVNLTSNSQRFVSDDVQDQIRQSSTSTVQFNQSWPRVGRSLTLSSRAYQDFAQNETTVTLPTLAFSQQRLFPFKRGRDDRWYEKISASYSANASNTYAFKPLNDSTGVTFVEGLFDRELFTAATGEASPFDYSVRQSIPVQATFQVPRFNLQLQPSLTYEETWAGESTRQTYFAEADSLAVTQRPGFTAVRELSAALTARTEFFGTFPLRVGPVDGVRHRVNPSLSFRVAPDYAPFGFVREVQTNADGDTRRYGILSGIPVDPTRTLTATIGNEILARVARRDTSGAVQREVVRLLSFDVSGGYNFAAEQRPFDDVRVGLRTEFLGVNARATAVYSAYALSESGALTDETVLDQTGRPVRLTNATLTASRSFSSRRAAGRAPDLRAVRRPVSAPGERYDPTNPAYDDRAVGYVDYSAPWAFNLSLTASTRPGLPGADDDQTTAALELNSLTAQITPNWRVTGSTGLDLTTRELTQTVLGLRRDLHCWELAIDWRPIGVTRGFGFSLYVKSGLLKDVLRFDPRRSLTRALPF